MGIHNNFPATSWIKLDGISVVKNEDVYIVKDFKTNLKYIYWSLDTPDKLTASNIMLDRTANRFLVAINNKGECILSPNDEIIISFDGNSVDSITENIWGLYEKDKEYGDRFVSVEQDIEGITQTVGQVQEDLTEEISKVEQKADSIDLSVKKLDRDYNNDKELQELRENVNTSIISFNSALGIFKSDITDIFKDSKISSEEKVEVKAHIDILEDRKLEVINQVDKVISLMENQNDIESVTSLNSQKQVFINAIDNLISLVNTSISDNTVVPTEVTIVTDAFGKASVETNTLKNTIDEMIFLGTGGIISEELAKVSIKSDEIISSVSNIEEKIDGSGGLDQRLQAAEQKITPDSITQTVKDSQVIKDIQTGITTNSSNISKISQKADSISLEVSQKVDSNNIISSINQTAESIRINAGKINLNGYVTFSELGDYVTESDLGYYGTTTIHGDRIRTGTLSVDKIGASSSNPIIQLFYGNGLNCALDATAYMNEGIGSAIRLKRDDSNYLFVGNGNISLYCTGSNNNESALCTFNGDSNTFRIKSKGGNLILNNGVSYNGTKLSQEGHTHSEYATSSSVSTAQNRADSAYNLASSANNTANMVDDRTYYSSNNYVKVYGGSEAQLRAGSAWVYVTNYAAWVMYPYYDGKMDLGTSYERWRTIYSTNSLNISDRKFKENIKYIDNAPKLARHINNTPFLDFIKNDLKVATYTYKAKDSDGYSPLANDQIGFIANDIADTEVGRTFVYDYGEESGYMFSPTGYTTVIAKALQEEIKQRESEISELKNEIGDLKAQVSSLMEIVNKLTNN